MERRDNRLGEITPELLENLMIEQMLREDELADRAAEDLDTAGRLNDPDLSELAKEVEEYALRLDQLERMMKENTEPESKK